MSPFLSNKAWHQEQLHSFHCIWCSPYGSRPHTEYFNSEKLFGLPKALREQKSKMTEGLLNLVKLANLGVLTNWNIIINGQIQSVVILTLKFTQSLIGFDLGTINIIHKKTLPIFTIFYVWNIVLTSEQLPLFE